MDVHTSMQKIVARALQLEQGADSLRPETQLLGGFAEFNSLTITAIVTAIEDEFDVDIDDEDLSAEVFETMGALVDFVAERLA